MKRLKLELKNMWKTMLSREKNKISYLHFILSVLVILIHSINNETKIEQFFSIEKGIGQFAVPLFFVISGFLFFRNAYTMNDVKQKMRKRVYTLLIPYLLWNLIYYVLYMLRNPGMGLDIAMILDAAFNYTYNPAFWFIYQLILLIIISPILFYALKNVKYIIIFIILISLSIILEYDLPYINEDAIIYFFSGALFSKIYNSNKMSFISKKSFVIALISAIIAFILNRWTFNMIYVNVNFRTIFIWTIILVRLFAAFTIFYFVDLIFKYDKVYSFMENTFFLYAIHYMIVKAMIVIMKYIEYKFLILIAPNIFIEIFEIVVFTISPIVCIIVNYYLSRYIKKKNAKVYAYLSGNR